MGTDPETQNESNLKWRYNLCPRHRLVLARVTKLKDQWVQDCRFSSSFCLSHVNLGPAFRFSIWHAIRFAFLQVGIITRISDLSQIQATQSTFELQRGSVDNLWRSSEWNRTYHTPRMPERAQCIDQTFVQTEKRKSKPAVCKFRTIRSMKHTQDPHPFNFRQRQRYLKDSNVTSTLHPSANYTDWESYLSYPMSELIPMQLAQWKDGWCFRGVLSSSLGVVGWFLVHSGASWTFG